EDMPISNLKPLERDQFDYWKAVHLLNRAGFGGTPAQARALANMGLEDAVDYIVEYEEVAAPAVGADQFDKDIMRPANEEERMEVEQARRSGNEAALEKYRQERQMRQAEDRRQIGEMQKWWLKRMIETPRPLEEKMTLFWHGHFATGYRSIEDSYHMFQQNQFLRANATGSFAELVYGIVRDPAMLRYLNNDQNRKEKPNENLARELMELFTLGEGNLYTENDIKEGARALTGFNFEDDAFVFRPQMHDTGNKTILGQKGNWDGIDFCKIILSTRTPSEFICWKLYRYLVSDLPGDPDKDRQAFITKWARTFRDSNYQIKPLLKTLFKSDHFYDQANTAALIKNPIQLIVQAIRSLHTPARNLSALASAADLMGQNIFFPPSVKGWDGGRAWINTSTLFVRQNLLIYLLTGRRPESYEWEADGRDFDPIHLIAHLKEDAGEAAAQPTITDVVSYLLRFNLGAEPHDDRVKALVEFANANGGTVDRPMLIGLLSLIAAMPEYQLC
ncbi:MAG TPA: DUF1800 domain-containing protein, partial [Phycisphaerales bacterium]|nr:DUF1800 domain-containing protein [Phycisphaerales bacterium]